MIFTGPPMNLTINVRAPEWILVFWNINSVITFLINGFSAYCILYQSTKEMAMYKWFIFNIWFWTFMADFMLASIVRPISYFPLPGGSNAGTLVAKLPLDFQYLSLCACGFVISNALAALISSITYRWQLLFQYSPLLENNKRMIGFFVATHLEVSVTFSVLLRLSKPPHDIMDEYIKFHVLNWRDIVSDKSSYVVFNSQLNWWCSVTMTVMGIGHSVLLATVSFVAVPLGVGWCGVMLGDSYRRLHRLQSGVNMSTKTKKMHIQMILSLVLQAVIPSTCYIVPALTLMGMLILDIQTDHIQDHSQIMMAIFSTHATMNCLVMLSSVKCYRRFVLRFLRLDRIFDVSENTRFSVNSNARTVSEAMSRID